MKLAVKALLLALALSASAGACGCGLALADEKVFNNLKESNVYLVADVHEDESFSIQPFFRFVSLAYPANVTMVFPMKAVPTSVTGEKMPMTEFRQKSGIDAFEKEKKNLDAAKGTLSAAALTAGVIYLVGLGPAIAIGFLWAMLSITSGIGAAGSGLVASYSFEGGTLEVYDASSPGTLGEVVAQAGMQYQGEVKKMIDKYSNYYVAVLKLEVPAALSAGEMSALRNECPATYDYALGMLKKTEVRLHDLDSDRYRYEGKNCSSLGKAFVANAIGYVDPNARARGDAEGPEGVLLTMEFKAGDPIFYPVSIVNSYNYPVASQSYFVKTPLGKEASFKSSAVNETFPLAGKRWYQITDTANDLEVEVAPAGIGTTLQDYRTAFKSFVGANAFWIVLLTYAGLIYNIHRSLKNRGITDLSAIGIVFAGGFYYAWKLWQRSEKSLAYLTIASALAFGALALVAYAL